MLQFKFKNCKFKVLNFCYFLNIIIISDHASHVLILTYFRALFPCGDKLVCIIDDREDVWNFAPNLVHVKPYHFFQHTGDINAPLGLGKSERDLEEGGKYFYSKKVKSIKRLRKKRKLLNSDVSSCDIEDLDSSGARKGEVQDKTEALKRDECVDQKLIKQTEIRNDNEDKKEMDDSNDCESVTDVDSCCNAHHEYVDSIAEMCKDEEKDTQVKNDNVSPTTGMDRDSFGKKSDEVEQHPIPDEESDSIKTVETDKEVQQREEELLLQSETATPHQTQVIEDEEVKSKLPNAESDTKLNKNENGDDLLVVEDGDDYLMYLSDILITVHKAFYEMYDKMKQDAEGIVLPQEIPDLKRVIPYVRKKVLKGVRIVFSGVIPTNLPLEKSRIFHVAKSLGAEIQTQLVPRKKDNKAIATSHVVAARLGTVKVNEAKRCRGIHIVTPEWLWCCAERWERVNEMLFPLTKETTFENKLHFAEPMKTMVSKPDAEIVIKGIPDVEVNVFPTYDPVTGKRINRPVTSNNVEIKAPSGLEQTSSVEGTDVKASENGSDPEGNFATSLNPLLSFSTEDIAKMDQEVEDILDSLDSDEEESEGEITKKLVLGKKRKRESDADSSSSTSSSSSKSLTGEYPHGWRGVSRGEKITDTDDILDGDCSDSELENSDYPRGILNQKIEGSDNDSERNSEDDFDTSVGSVDEEMAAAVEREFLGL